MVILLVALPNACTKDTVNQDVLNTSYTSEYECLVMENRLAEQEALDKQQADLTTLKMMLLYEH